MCGNIKAIGRLEAFELFTNRFSALKLLKDRCRKLNIKIPYMLLAFAGILSIISTLQGILTPYLYSLLVDDVMVGGKIELLFGIILKMVVLFLVNILIIMLSTYLNVRFSNCVSVLMRMNLFRKILKKNFSALKKEDLGKQQELILNDSAIVSGFLMVQIKDFVCSLLFVVVYICMMLWVSKWLTVVSLITIPLVSIWGRYVGKKLNESQLKLWEVGSKNSTNIYNTFQRWREVKIQGLEDDLTGKYKESLKPEKDINLVWMLYYAIDGVVYEIKNSFVQNLVPYFVGGLLIIQNQLTIGALLMFITYLSNLSVHIDMILTSITNFESNRAAFARVFETLEIEEEKCDEWLSCPSNCGIEIENISFSYDTSLPTIFDNANYTFESGKTYLVSGKSGGGKSTLIKLILGVVSPTFGGIKYGGVLLENMDSQSLFKHMGIIMQESYFFNFSILENLTLLNENVTEDDVKMACKLACISEYIESLPEKYDTLIGERGIKLSGGQRQRLAIARMILHNPDIIIMDEATSSLDNKCETEILQNLEKKFAEKMIIMISHKPDIEFGFYKKIKIVDKGIKEVYE